MLLLRHRVIHYNGNRRPAFRLLFRHTERECIMLFRPDIRVCLRQRAEHPAIIACQRKRIRQCPCHGKVSCLSGYLLCLPVFWPGCRLASLHAGNCPGIAELKG